MIFDKYANLKILGFGRLCRITEIKNSSYPCISEINKINMVKR